METKTYTRTSSIVYGTFERNWAYNGGGEWCSDGGYDFHYRCNVCGRNKDYNAESSSSSNEARANRDMIGRRHVLDNGQYCQKTVVSYEWK